MEQSEAMAGKAPITERQAIHGWWSQVRFAMLVLWLAFLVLLNLVSLFVAGAAGFFAVNEMAGGQNELGCPAGPAWEVSRWVSAIFFAGLAVTIVGTILGLVTYCSRRKGVRAVIGNAAWAMFSLAWPSVPAAVVALLLSAFVGLGYLC